MSSGKLSLMSRPTAHRSWRPLPGKASWNLALLTAPEPKRRNRRTIDATFLLLASVVTGLAAVVARSAPEVDAEISEALASVSGWAPNFWRGAFVLALAFALLIVGDVLFRRRWTLARDLLLAVVVVAVVGSILGRIVDKEWFQAEAHVFSNWGFPEFRLACAVAIFTVAGPELVRPARVLSFWLVGAAGLACVILGTGLMSQVLGAVALGLGAGALVRFALGSAAGVPPTERVRVALASLGVAVDGLTIAERQRIGSAEFVGDSANGPHQGACAGTRRSGHAAVGAPLAPPRVP